MVLVQHTVTIAVDFGTSRSGFAYLLKGQDSTTKINTYRAWSTTPVDKALTQILYDPKGKPIHYGYDVPRKFSEFQFAKSDEEIKQYSLFKFFKMELRDNEELLMRNPHTGKEFPLVKVIADYLIFIKKHIETCLNINVETDFQQVRWCFTVPAIWTDKEKQLTKEACVLAGFIEDIHVSDEDFMFAPEPEAAAAYCMNTLLQTGRLSKGETFLVCDAGGGTLDLTSHYLAYEGSVPKLESLTSGGGGPWGASQLDKKFIQVMEEDVFGQEMIEELREKFPMLYFELCDLWENKKLDITELDSTQYLVPSQDLKDFIQERVTSNSGSAYRRGRIILESNILHKIYDEVLENICNEIQDEIQAMRKVKNDSNLEFHNIFVVGGFGESQVLQDLITSRFGSKFCKVTCPPNAGAAIVKGAVMLGLDPSLIMTRRMRRAYGITTFQKFDPSKHHRQDKKVKVRGEWKSKDAYDIFVECEEEVRYDQVIVREYKVSDEDQQSMVLELITSVTPGTIYVDEQGTSKCGEIIIDMSGTTGLDRIVEVSMSFGKSEIEVSAHDLTTGLKYKAALDFTKNQFTNDSQNMSSRDLAPYHFIFVNDISGSMADTDAQPRSHKFMNNNNRVGALYESCEMFLSTRSGSNDIVSCIMYNNCAYNLFQTRPLSVDLVDYMINTSANGGTSFAEAMKAVQLLVQNSSILYPKHRGIVLFMSDGEDGNIHEPVTITRQLVIQYNIVLHAIQLGLGTPSSLIELASAGGGEFKSARDAHSLASVYESLANHPVAN